MPHRALSRGLEPQDARAPRCIAGGAQDLALTLIFASSFTVSPGLKSSAIDVSPWRTLQAVPVVL